MTFDEFFRKKRVDLAALEKAEPTLFSEFKTHYEQMGEKSFDHTKKYWFNKTRRQFPLAPEVKTEKPHIANPIAEQTITGSLSETVSQPAAKVGFTPRFKVGIAKPAGEEKPALMPETKEETTETQPQTIAKPAGFTPRFKMNPKTEGAEQEVSESEETQKPAAESPAGAQSTQPAEPASKPAGFTPRFKMKPKSETEANIEALATPGSPAQSESGMATEEPARPAPTASKPAGFTPRFKMTPKAETEQTAGDGPVESAVVQSESESVAETPAPETPVKKPAYKPRFVPPKPKEE